MTPSIELCRRIAARMKEALPLGSDIEVTREGEFLIKQAGFGSESHASPNPEDDDGSEEDDYAQEYFLGLLQHLQSVLAEALHEPWPSDQHDLPLPYVIMDDVEIRLGFGRPSDPLLELARVPVDSGSWV
jgi:hypothetical protein